MTSKLTVILARDKRDGQDWAKRFALAAGNATAKVNLVALGLFFWILVPLIALVHSG